MSSIIKTERGYTGWGFSPVQRDRLLKIVPPTLPDVIAHHITEDARARSNTPLPQAIEARIVGVAANDRIQALVVEIDGSVQRVDGELYHCTWSLDRSAGAKPMDAKALVAAGFHRLPNGALPIEIMPQFFPEQPGVGAHQIDFARIAKLIAKRRETAALLGAKGQPVHLHHGDGRKAIAQEDKLKRGISLVISDKYGVIGYTDYANLQDAVYDALTAGFRVRTERPSVETNRIVQAGIDEIEVG